MHRLNHKRDKYAVDALFYLYAPLIHPMLRIVLDTKCIQILTVRYWFHTSQKNMLILRDCIWNVHWTILTTTMIVVMESMKNCLASSYSNEWIALGEMAPIMGWTHIFSPTHHFRVNSSESYIRHSIPIIRSMLTVNYSLQDDHLNRTTQIDVNLLFCWYTLIVWLDFHRNKRSF